MKSQDLLKNANLPEAPGVYFFLGKNNEILYIGKATSLKDRVASYFRKDLVEARGPLLVSMMPLIEKIDFRETDSVLEALLLEADLIKKFKPKHNTKEKDDRSYNCIVITKEDFPRVLIVREKNLKTALGVSYAHIFGPFPEGKSLKEALKIVRKIFPFRDTCIPFQSLDQKKRLNIKPCFNAQIGLCPGVCTGAISKKDYQKTIKHLTLFLEGKKGTLIKQLEQEMRSVAKEKRFEEAHTLKKKIFSLNHIHDVALMSKESVNSSQGFRIESYDTAHLQGASSAAVMTVSLDGRIAKSEYKKFKLRMTKGGDDVGALSEVLTRRFKHNEWPKPDIILVDGGIAQKNAAEKIVHDFGFSIPVLSLVKDNRHAPSHFLGDQKLVETHTQVLLALNAEAHRFALSYHRLLRHKKLFSIK